VLAALAGLFISRETILIIYKNQQLKLFEETLSYFFETFGSVVDEWKLLDLDNLS